MFRHMLKLAWKRKSRNVMLTLEILLAFVIVFAIAAFGTRSLSLYYAPTGMQTANVWAAQLRFPDEGSVDPAIYQAFKSAVEALPEVEAVSFTNITPYTMSTWSTSVTAPDSGKRAPTHMLIVTDSYLSLLDVKLVRGRAFSAEDDGASVKPVIINERLAEELFGSADPLGKTFVDGDKDDKNLRTLKVAGVIEDLRYKGDLMAPNNLMIERYDPTAKRAVLRTILLRLVPGTPRSFETALSRKLQAVRNDWAYEISPLPDLRKTILREMLTPIAILAVVAGFLLVMVAFGLFGVLWQNTTQRIPEIGLRRALGASANQIYRQIIAEQMLLSTAAMLLALILLVQLPITGALGDNLNWKVFAGATALSMSVIYLLSLLCSLYPGWRASRLSPTEALHYE